MAATVTRLAPAGQLTTPREAVTVYLATLAGAEQAGTRKIYGSVLRGLASAFAAEADVSAITAAALAEWFTAQWQDRAPSTWNVALDAIRSAAAYWAQRDGPLRTSQFRDVVVGADDGGGCLDLGVGVGVGYGVAVFAVRHWPAEVVDEGRGVLDDLPHLAAELGELAELLFAEDGGAGRRGGLGEGGLHCPPAGA